jgi:hypothetical protein
LLLCEMEGNEWWCGVEWCSVVWCSVVWCSVM